MRNLSWYTDFDDSADFIFLDFYKNSKGDKSNIPLISPFIINQ